MIIIVSGLLSEDNLVMQRWQVIESFRLKLRLHVSHFVKCDECFRKKNMLILKNVINVLEKYLDYIPTIAFYV